MRRKRKVKRKCRGKSVGKQEMSDGEGGGGGEEGKEEEREEVAKKDVEERGRKSSVKLRDVVKGDIQGLCGGKVDGKQGNVGKEVVKEKEEVQEVQEWT